MMQHKHFLKNKNTPQRSLKSIRYFNPVTQIRQANNSSGRPRIHSVQQIYEEHPRATRHCSWCWNTSHFQRTLEGAGERLLSGKSVRATTWVRDENQRDACGENKVTWVQGRKVQGRKETEWPFTEGAFLRKAWEASPVPLEICWSGIPVKVAQGRNKGVRTHALGFYSFW